MFKLFTYFTREAGPRYAHRWGWLSFFALFNGLVEVATLGLLTLFIASLTSLGDVLSSRYILFVKSILGDYWFSEPQIFYVSLGIVTISLVIIKNILVAVHYYATSRYEGLVNEAIGIKMLRGFMGAPYTWSSTQNPADVHSFIQWRLFVGFFVGQSMILVSEVLVSLLLIVIMFYFEPLVTLVVAGVTVGAGAFFFHIFKKRITSYGVLVNDSQREGDRICLMNIQGLRDIVTFNATEEFLPLFDKQVGKFAWSTAWQKLFSRAPMLALESFGFIGIVGGSILMVAFCDYTTARMMGTLSLVAVSAWRILPALNRTLVALGAIRGYTPYLEKVQLFIQTLNKFRTQDSRITPVLLPDLHDSIRIDELTYAYSRSSQNALSGLNLTIPKGGMVGIIGHSGAGKSTLTDLLTGFLTPLEGEILIDGTPLTEESKRSWRDNLGLIPQRPYFFDGSIMQNVAYSFFSESIDQEKVRNCCRQAGVEEFVENLPLGLDSSVGENGNLLSGGQGQRLAIARALYKNPQVLIFDEATSSLDDKNAKKIRETILEFKGKKTIIIIAHRLRAVQDCDTIFWLENGKVIESGPPEVILPHYTNFGKEQAAKQKRESTSDS